MKSEKEPKKAKFGKRASEFKVSMDSQQNLPFCDKAHVAEQVRLKDADEACDDGVH